MYNNPLDTRLKLNMHKTFMRHSGLDVNVLCTWNIGRVSTGNRPSKYVETKKISFEKECIWQHYETISKGILKPSGHLPAQSQNRNNTTKCEICSKLTMKTPERRQSHSSGVFIVNFEHVSQLTLVFLLLNLNS